MGYNRVVGRGTPRVSSSPGAKGVLKEITTHDVPVKVPTVTKKESISDVKLKIENCDLKQCTLLSLNEIVCRRLRKKEEKVNLLVRIGQNRNPSKSPDSYENTKTSLVSNTSINQRRGNKKQTGIKP